MAKKKADKRRQEKEQQKEQKEKEERKRMKLQELDAKRREKPAGDYYSHNHGRTGRGVPVRPWVSD